MYKSLPTEREVLRCILKTYKKDYPGTEPQNNDPYLQIVVGTLATELKCQPELLFGYLYYFLDHKYRYQTDDKMWTHLFALKVGNRLHCVNFPYLVGILAANEQEHRRNQWAIWLSIAALMLSLVSIVVQIVTS